MHFVYKRNADTSPRVFSDSNLGLSHLLAKLYSIEYPVNF